MGSASIGGLASGLDTASIISQFMQLEAATQTKLKSQRSTQQSAITAMQSLNTKLASLATTAKGLAAPSTTAATTVWSSLQTSSSSATVSATARSTASPGTLSVSVGQTALSHRVVLTDAAALDSAGTVPTSVTLSRGGTDVEITSDGTLGGLVSAINGADAGVRASTIKIADGSYRLVVESSTTGADQAFTLSATGGGAILGGLDAAGGQTGRDAQITVSGVQVTSRTNTFTEVLAGVDLTLSASATAGSTADITVTRDAGTRTTAVKDFVSALNGALSSIKSTSDAKTGSAPADSTLRSVATQLTTAIYPTDGTSLSRIGIQVDRYGAITFDEAAFAAAFTADPTGTQAAFTAFAGRVQSVADRASDSIDGSVTNAINGRTSTVKRLDASIEAWDTRLALRQKTLEAQYTALETAMSQMQSQSSWLSSQLSSLSSSGG